MSGLAQHPWNIRTRIALLVWLAASSLTALTPGSLRAEDPLRAGERQPVRQVSHHYHPFPVPAGNPNANELMRQTDEDVRAKSWGCVQCHAGVADMHQSKTVKLGCVDCHGGDPTAPCKEQAHVLPRFADAWLTSANPVRSYTLLNHECPEFIRFVNPGDLRVAHLSCGQCHPGETLAVKKSMMTHGCMLWGAALYNNGGIPNKWPRYGESYNMNGAPQRLLTVWNGQAENSAVVERDLTTKGVVPFLDPLPRFEMTQPGNILRIFERGGRFRPEVGIPERLEEPGRPRTRLSNRGLGTENRTDPVFIGLQKTRLLDPTLNFLGTNDHPGDYRSSGCSACHVAYANDRSPVHSGPFSAYGNRGLAAANPDPPGPLQFVTAVDPMIPPDEPGHPITHKFTLQIPTSQCIVCHVHPGTNVLNSYLGFMWWDNETDGELMYPREQRYLSSEELANAQMSNPEEAAARGLWSDPEFLANLTDLNTATKHTQFADFHGHGWAFRAVFKKDRQGNLLDHKGKVIEEVTNEKLRAAMEPLVNYVGGQVTHDERAKGKCENDVPVHLMDIHLERGMHCVDCHFNQDNHGNTKLYGEVRAAIEITCTDCHGTAQQSIVELIVSADRNGQPLRMPTTGPAAPDGGHNLLALRTPFGKPRFEVVGRDLIQRSMVEPQLTWKVKQTAATIDPKHPDYNPKSHMAKTVRWSGDELTWGGRPDENGDIDGRRCAHVNHSMNCIACHTSWNASCFGCHLPQKANKKAPSLHNEGDVSRNYVSYNFQTLRDDVFMLARDGLVTGNKVGPARSSCAIHVGSYNNNRESIYVQQQTISGSGMSGIAFSTNVPHTVRGASTADAMIGGGVSETKMCSDCHVAKENDNNAIMAQLLMHGTNYTNFIGKYCWVAAGEHGLAGVVVTETEEPQAVIGSTLHSLAFPDYYRKHLHDHGVLKHAHEHPGKDIGEQLLTRRKPEVLMVQNRGEFLYAACGEGGFRVFDIAFIDHKGFSERITTAPVSPAGQRFYVRTSYCTAFAAPTTMAPDPTRIQPPENHEQAVHGLYAYVYVTDRDEGLILVGAGTLLDGNPLNNFLERALTYNPNGLLNGARNITIVGTYAYICCDAGLVVISLEDPLHPQVHSVIGPDVLSCPTSVQVQFRYAYVCDQEGVKVFDVTHLDRPEFVAVVPLHEAHNIYLARTYAYVAAGHEGLVILDMTRPDAPFIDQVFTAGGMLQDVRDVKLGITYTSEFAYLADGCGGLKVVQLTSPDTPGNAGFSPRPTPCLVATFPIPKGGEALAIAEGLDRDRAVDESGNQIAVFGRVGARPFNLAEQQRLYLRTGPEHGPREGTVWQVSNDPFDASVYRLPFAAPATTEVPPRALGPVRAARVSAGPSR